MRASVMGTQRQKRPIYSCTNWFRVLTMFQNEAKHDPTWRNAPMPWSMYYFFFFNPVFWKRYSFTYECSVKQNLAFHRLWKDDWEKRIVSVCWNSDLFFLIKFLPVKLFQNQWFHLENIHDLLNNKTRKIFSGKQKPEKTNSVVSKDFSSRWVHVLAELAFRLLSWALVLNCVIVC